MVVVAYPLTGLASSASCKQVFASKKIEDEVLNLSIQVESSIGSLQNDSRLYDADLFVLLDSFLEHLLENGNDFSKLELNDAKEEWSILQQQKQLLAHKKSYNQAKKVESDSPLSKTKLDSLNDLLNTPELLVAKKPYQVTFASNIQQTVIFYDHVIEAVFRPKTKDEVKQAKFLFEKILKGYVAQEGKSGIKKLTANSSFTSRYGNFLYELKTIGRLSGSIRLGIVKDLNGVLHFIDHVVSNEHNPSWKNTLLSRANGLGIKTQSRSH